MLAERAETLGEPYTRHLGGKVRELRFHLLRQQTRGDVLAGARPSGGPADRPPQDPQRRDCRSRTCPRAQKICEATHGIAHDSYEREGDEMSADHHSYEAIARQRRGSAEYREGYDEARRAFLIGQAVPPWPRRQPPWAKPSGGSRLNVVRIAASEAADTRKLAPSTHSTSDSGTTAASTPACAEPATLEADVLADRAPGGGDQLIAIDQGHHGGGGAAGEHHLQAGLDEHDRIDPNEPEIAASSEPGKQADDRGAGETRPDPSDAEAIAAPRRLIDIWAQSRPLLDPLSGLAEPGFSSVGGRIRGRRK